MSKTHFIVFTLSLIILTSAVLAFTILRLKTVNKELIFQTEHRFTEEVKRTLKDHVGVVYSLIDSQSKINLVTKEESEYRSQKVINHVVNKELEYRLKNVINIVETILKLKAQLVKKGKMTQEEASAQVIDEIKRIKFRYNGGLGYIWLYDTTELIIPSVFSSSEDEQNMYTKFIQDKNALDNQRQLFKTFVLLTSKENGGEAFVHVQYKWPSKSGGERDVNKLSYIKLFPEWQWIIGAGISLDNNLDDEFPKKVTSDGMINIKDKLKNAIKAMKYNENKGYFWIIDTSDKKSPKYVIPPPKLSSLENQELIGPLSKYKALVENIIEICAEEEKVSDDKPKGQGYIQPTAQGLFRQNMPRLMYAECHKQLNWIIGTNYSDTEYKEHLDRTKQREKNLKAQVNKLAILLLILATTIIFIVMMTHVLINNWWNVLGR